MSRNVCTLSTVNIIAPSPTLPQVFGNESRLCSLSNKSQPSLALLLPWSLLLTLPSQQKDLNSQATI